VSCEIPSSLQPAVPAGAASNAERWNADPFSPLAPLLRF
jgi:hypothetical protein